MKLTQSKKLLSSRVVHSILALAIASPAAHAATYTLYTAGLYDLGTIPGTSVSHVGNYNSVLGTYTLTNNSISTGILNNNGQVTTTPLVNSSGSIAGAANRYANDTATTAGLGANTWYFDSTTHQTYQTGLTGVQYNGTTGTQSNSYKAFNDAGFLAGSSGYTNGANVIGAFDAWIYSPPTVANPNGLTTKIVLPNSAAYTGGSFQTSYIQNNGGTGPGPGGNFLAENYSIAGMNNSGVVIGTATQYFGTTTAGLGQAAWVSGPNGVATRIGLTSADYTPTSGNPNQASTPKFINGNGQVAGTSTNFAHGSGSDGFFYDPTTGLSTLIGLSDLPTTDPNYSTSPTLTGNTILTMTNTVVIGTASTGAPVFGGPAWSYNIATATTTKITLVGTTPPNTVSGAYNGGSTASYVGATPDRQLTQILNGVNDINASGQIAANQRIYIVGGTSAGTANAGADALLFDGTTTKLIGLTDTNHTAASGTTVRSNTVQFLSNNGYVSGTATIFNGNLNAVANTNQGSDAWVYSPTTGLSTLIGLKSIATPINNATYVGTTSSSFEVAMNAAGYVVGQTARYAASTNNTSRGQDSFIYTPDGSSVQIGLTTANTPAGPYLSSDTATESSTVSFINNNVTDPMAAGTTVKYSGSATNGNDAWLYDSATNTNYGITTLLNPTVQFLSDSGVLVGSYTSGTTTEAYAFTVVAGVPTLLDLGTASAALLASGGWAQLANATIVDSLGDIVGRGVLANDSAVYSSASNSAVYELAVPEPTSLALLGVGAVGLLSRRRTVKK